MAAEITRVVNEPGISDKILSILDNASVNAFLMQSLIQWLSLVSNGNFLHLRRCIYLFMEGKLKISPYTKKDEVNSTYKML